MSKDEGEVCSCHHVLISKNMSIKRFYKQSFSFLNRNVESTIFPDKRHKP